MSTSARQPNKWKPARECMPDVEATEYLADQYAVANDAALWGLFERVREYATRDHRPGRTMRNFRLDRDDAFRRARTIKNSAARLKQELHKLREEAASYTRDYEFNPVLMESIFDVDVGLPDVVWVPDELSPLSVSPEATMFGDLNAWLDGLSQLPLRPRLTRARIAPRTLQKCVAECRRYWRALGRTWNIDALTVPETRKDNEPTALIGQCERFVCDLLRAAGMSHTLEELHTAMAKRQPQGT